MGVVEVVPDSLKVTGVIVIVISELFGDIDIYVAGT